MPAIYQMSGFQLVVCRPLGSWSISVSDVHGKNHGNFLKVSVHLLQNHWGQQMEKQIKFVHKIFEDKSNHNKTGEDRYLPEH